MQLPIQVKRGKVVKNSEKIKEYFSSLGDGDYVLTIERINPLVTTRDYQKAYFDKVDICVSSTGNDRYTIHDEFKKHSGIDSTKDLSNIEWKNLLKQFTWWAYSKFDCIV